MRIVISSGHGKYIRGASGYLDEVDEARRVVEHVADYLSNAGVECTTYHDDLSHSQNENLNRIVDFHNSKTRDLDVSVHFNAYQTTSQPMGTECLYVTQSTLADKVSGAVAKAGSFIDRGPKLRSDLFFLNNTEEPAVLIETCFVDSKTDANLYNANFDAICRAIAESLSGQTIGDQPPPEAERPPLQPPGGSQPPTEQERPEIAEGDNGPYVVSVQESLGLPADGDFGSVTDAGVKGFQRAWAIPGGADGFVGENTWNALDDLDERMADGTDGISQELAQQIERLVADSPVIGYEWDDRGPASEGYISGMCKTFALALKRLGESDPATELMAQAATTNTDKDALAWYADIFRAKGMDNSQSGQNTLRHLFVMLVGLGMRESSGNHWEGRDMSAENVQSDTCESGLFQSSWNLSSCASEIKHLFNEFKADPNGFRQTFTQDLEPTTGNLDNYGSGDGCYYQWLAKFCPAFAVLMTGVGLRRLRQHWGPINRKEVEIVPIVDTLLKDVEKLTVGWVA